MKKIKIAYYILTVLLSILILLGAFFDVAAGPDARAALAHLGYPAYLLYIVGWAKILGIIGIWQNKVAFLREWAYAGLMIDVTGALASSIFSGDAPSLWIPAIIGMILVGVSYALFRKSRTA
jgi:hypothetical protein